MLETLHTTLAFIVAIALLIAVHEFGHFIVARKLGIKVEKFSIGFGPSLISWWSRDREVQYVIAAIPLGGYVKMLGETPSEQGDDAKQQLSDEERARAFDVQPPWKRASVAVAGPLFNFFFAILAYMSIGWIGQMVMPPVIGSIAPASIAEQSGLLEGDIIRSLNGSPVHSWVQVEEKMKQVAGDNAEIEVDRNGALVPLDFYLPSPEQDALLINVSESALGIFPGVKVVVDSVAAGSAAQQGGVLSGDQILQAQGEPVTNIRDLIGIIRQKSGEPLSLQVQRNETFLNLTVIPAVDESGFGRIGVRLASSPIVDPVLYRMGVVEGLFFGFERTWQMTTMTIEVLGKMVTSAISPENLGGPIAIAQLAGKTAELGLISFMSFLALISVNLAVLNLLPVPVLDGGHLAYIALEKVRGKPLSQTTMERTQVIGIGLIVVLMLFAFYNDLLRLFRG